MVTHRALVTYFASFSMLLLLGKNGFQAGNGAVDAFLFSVSESEDQPQQAQQPATDTTDKSSGKPQRHILVFGGNGFLGAETVERLIKLDEVNVTLVNRGNWYWDSKTRISPHVRTISCDRKNGVESCDDLVQLVQQTEKFEAVIDFSAYGRREIADALALFRGSNGSSTASSKVALYVHISTDSIYDVCDPDRRSPTGQALEIDAVRPSDPDLRRTLAEHHEYANGKMEAEEELINQRKSLSSSTSPNGSDDSTSAPIEEEPTGIPYVILRLPDVLGPRDTTYRFWFYHLWVRVASLLPKRPVIVPQFLLGYNNSFVYVDDVARTVVDIVDRITSGGDRTSKKSPVVDEVFNLAWPQNISLDGFLRDVDSVLRMDNDERLKFHSEDYDNLYLYPTVRRGPIDSSKAVEILGWRPTDWHTAIRSTVEFYEAAMKDEKWLTQRDEIIQIVTGQLYSTTAEDREGFFSTLEQIYGIDLAHFRPKRDEL